MNKYDIKANKHNSITLNLLYDAHYLAARRALDVPVSEEESAAKVKSFPLSTEMFRICMTSTGSLEKSIASAILSMGEKHAPIAKCHLMLDRIFEAKFGVADLLRYIEEKGYEAIGFGQDQKRAIVPGFGHSVIVKEIDPLFFPAGLRIVDSEEWSVVTEIFCAIKERKKIEIFPNAAIITACIGRICGLNAEQSIYLAIAPRIKSWLNI